MAYQQEVHNILNSITKLTGLGTCFYDLEKFFTSNYGRMDKSYTGHYCQFCNAVRDLNGGRDACTDDDRTNVVNLAQIYKKPFFHVCHIGICEYIVPIFKDNALLGVVFIGQCRINDETKFETIAKNLQKYDANCEYFKTLYDALPCTTREQLTAVGRLADYSFKLLASRDNFKITAGPKEPVTAAMDHINANYMNKLTLHEISDKLHVNSSYLSRKFKEKTGMSITDYINNFKIEKAKNLLQSTTIPIVHIAYNLGYTDQNYFTRIFKQFTGQTPSEYRNSSK